MRIILTAILLAFLFPDNLYAWGGGTHLLIGLDLLTRLQQLPPNLAILLGTYANDFLYGCLAPDIIVGKKYTHYMLNCHRWRVGQRLMQAAQDDPQRACAYGYLCHLAADVVAHNYFVPYKIIRSFSTISLRHTYWELRFESFVEPYIWEKAKEVCQSGRRHDDALLSRVMAPTLFSFSNSKRIFNSILLLSRLERWQMMIKALSSRSEHRLTPEDRQEYLGCTLEIVMDLMVHGEESFCWMTDPTGEAALEVAQEMRRYLRFLYKTGRFTKEQGMERVEFIKPTLRRSIHHPELLEILKGACHEPSSPFIL
jgi:hypothetical protein